MLPDRHRRECPAAGSGLQWLLVRRSLDKPHERAKTTCYASAATPLDLRVRVTGTSWAVGLDFDEVRRWDGWYRHSTLVLVTQAFLTVVRARVVVADEHQRGVPRCCRPT